jgi:superfamily II DNA or RNA helicase
MMSELVLRDYQRECCEKILAAYRANPSGKELVVLPTGAGKTICFVWVIAFLAREYSTTALIIAHRDELLNQAAEKYQAVNPAAVVGKIGAGVREYGGEVTVCSIQTVSRPHHLKNLKALYGTGKKLLIIVDEAHHQSAESYRRVLEALPDAFVLSVTATPERLDGQQIIQKAPLYQRTIVEMIKDGYLCNLKAIAIRTDVSLDEVKSLSGDFNEHELDLAINTPARNLRIVNAYLEHTPDKRAVAFCVTVNHASALAYAFNDMGVPAAVVEGNTSLEERRRIYQEFHDGKILVLCTVMVLTEGWDEPLCEVGIMARPTQSQGLYIQMAGRILRLAPNKPYATLLDITDNSTTHRLMPRNLKSVLKHDLREDETLLETLEREEKEKPEREAEAKRVLVRRLHERREKDIQLDLFALPDWELRENGYLVMIVGKLARIALIPCKMAEGLYDVRARLAPNFSKSQLWTSSLPLEQAAQYAEKKAHILLTEGKKLVDKNETWRHQPMSAAQIKMFRWYHLEHRPGMTRGEAADMIDAHKREIEERKQKKIEREMAKAKKREIVKGSTLNNRNQGFKLMR